MLDIKRKENCFYQPLKVGVEVVGDTLEGGGGNDDVGHSVDRQFGSVGVLKGRMRVGPDIRQCRSIRYPREAGPSGIFPARHTG